MIHKIVIGYVLQKFDETGKCITQEFIESDEDIWENGYGEPLDDQPFNYPIELKEINESGVDNIRCMNASVLFAGFEKIKQWFESQEIDGIAQYEKVLVDKFYILEGLENVVCYDDEITDEMLNNFRQKVNKLDNMIYIELGN